MLILDLLWNILSKATLKFIMPLSITINLHRVPKKIAFTSFIGQSAYRESYDAVRNLPLQMKIYYSNLSRRYICCVYNYIVRFSTLIESFSFFPIELSASSITTHVFVAMLRVIGMWNAVASSLFRKHFILILITYILYLLL